MRGLAVFVVMCVVACGHRDAPPPSSGSAVPMPTTGSAVAGSATVAVPAAAAPALPPPRELLAAVPADTPFVFVTFEPIASVWTRLAAGLDPAAVRAAAASRISSLAPTARVEYAAWSELAGALASGATRRLGVDANARFVIYGLGLVPVVRVELADAAAATETVERVFATAGMTAARRPGSVPTWLVDAGRSSLLVAVAGKQLVIARGSRDVLAGDAARIVGAAPAPLDESQLRGFAAEHALATHAVGWIDVPRVVALARTARGAAFDELEPRCRDALVDVLSPFGRIGLGLTEVSAKHVALAATFEVDAKTAATLATASKTAPSLPADLPGHPMLALAVTAPPDDLVSRWLGHERRLAAACSGAPAKPLPPPWSSIRSAALVIYDGRMQGLMPAHLDGYAAIAAPAPEPILDALAHVVPDVATARPRDGGPFVDVSLPFGVIVPSLALARRGQLLIGATGPSGKAHATELAVRDPAPLLRMLIDVGRLSRLRGAAPARVDDDDLFVAEESFLEQAGLGISAVLADLDVRVTTGAADVRLELAASLASPQPRAPRTSDPRTAVRDGCRALLWRTLGSTIPALGKLGVTDDLEAIQTTYTTSIEASQAVSSCAKLKPAERACLFAAKDPLAAAASCAPDPDGFHASKLELPPLFSFFGPDPLRARLHPPLDGGALRAKLVGTWERWSTFETEVWKIDAAGHVDVTVTEKGSAAKAPDHYTLEIHAAGELELHDADGYQTRGFVMPEADRFYVPSKDELAPVASEDHILAPLSNGFLVREPGGCWVITREGLLVTATCSSDPGHTLEVEYREPCASPAKDGCMRRETLRFLPGWIVNARVLEGAPFVRQH